MQYLKADTNTEVLIGPAVAVGDGFTPVTTLSLSTADEAELIKYGGATPLTVTSISANAMTAITSADGYYTLDLSTSNTDTEGFLTVLINDDSLILPIRVDFMVVNANVYDSLFAAATTDYLQVDTIQVTGTAQTANDNGADINAILTDTADIQPRVAAIEVDTSTTLQAELDAIQAAVITNAAGVDIAADIIAIKAETANILTDTAEIGTAGAGLTAVPWNASWDAEVQSEVNDGLVAYGASTVTTAQVNTEVDTALSDIHLDHLFATDYDPATPPGTATAYLNEIAESDAGVTRFTVNALENAPSGTGASAETIADAVWDEARAGHVTAGTYGETLATVETNIDNCDAPISTVDTVVDGIQTDLSNATDGLGAIKTAVDAIPTSNPSVADILTTQMTESYAADGTAPTLAQALFLIQQQLGDFAISGTTLTVRKVDGATTAATFTLNDGTNPTGITRAT